MDIFCDCLTGLLILVRLHEAGGQKRPVELMALKDRVKMMVWFCFVRLPILTWLGIWTNWLYIRFKVIRRFKRPLTTRKTEHHQPAQINVTQRLRSIDWFFRFSESESRFIHILRPFDISNAMNGQLPDRHEHYLIGSTYGQRGSRFFWCGNNLLRLIVGQRKVNRLD